MGHIKLKKNCNGCRALEPLPKGHGACRCELGYKTKNGKQILGIIVETIPLEICPKPKKTTDLIYFKQNGK